jgi:hypothetical protein
MENANKKTIDSIKYILKFESRIREPDDDICVEYEIIFIKFINYTFGLFQAMLPIYEKMKDIMAQASDAKEMEDKIKEFYTPGQYMTFGIRKEQLDYLEKYIDVIDEAQIKLSKYYYGKEDAQWQKNAIIKSLPENTG